MDNKIFDKKMKDLSQWVCYHGKNCGYDGECPKVGYLGYANGMTPAEWCVVCIAGDIIQKEGGNRRDYFWYDVDSSD